MSDDEKTIEAINCKAGEEGSGNLVYPIGSENELAWMIVDVCVDYIKMGDKPGAVRATSKFLQAIQQPPPGEDLVKRLLMVGRSIIGDDEGKEEISKLLQSRQPEKPRITRKEITKLIDIVHGTVNYDGTETILGNIKTWLKLKGFEVVEK